MAGFCSNCGSPVSGGAFCGSCGARVGQAAAPPVPVVQPSTPSPALPQVPAPQAPAPATSPAQTGGSSAIVKILFVVLGLIVLFGMIGMGSCLYLGYRAKKKADEIREAYKHNDLEKLAGALGANTGSGRLWGRHFRLGQLGLGIIFGRKTGFVLPSPEWLQRGRRPEQNSTAKRVDGCDRGRAVSGVTTNPSSKSKASPARRSA